MKKYIKIGILVLIALIFIGTFVFLYQKSQPKDTKYDIQKVETTNLVQTTVATGKIEPRDEVQIEAADFGYHCRSIQRSRRESKER